MSGFNNLKLLTKLAVPTAILLAVVIGLIVLAEKSLIQLSDVTQDIATNVAERRALALSLEATVNAATIREKNLIILRDATKAAEARQQFEQLKTEALAMADRMIAMSSGERQQVNRELKQITSDYFDVATKSVALSMQGDHAGAAQLSLTEGSAARLKSARATDAVSEFTAQTMKTVSADAEESADATGMTLIIAAAVGLVFAISLLGIIAIYGVVRPLTAMTAAMGRLAQGDLDIDVVGTERKDEVGLLARALQVFKDNAIEGRRLAALAEEESASKMRRAQRLDELTRSFQTSSSELVGALSAAASEMEATSGSMSSTAEETSQQAVAVAGAAEQTSANVQTVAASTEELATSVSEISRQVAESTKIAEAAVDEARRADVIVQSLASSAQKIGDVVALINDIAGQTNLLALNATIEAARAGEAGRGFAVVASEVKELAAQTGRATSDISSQISEIQEATTQAVEALRGIGLTIDNINKITYTVAAAVEEQGSATHEIARNVQQAAQGTQLVTSNIEQVKEAASVTGAASSQVLTAARELAQHSARLGEEVSGFLSDVQAA